MLESDQRLAPLLEAIIALASLDFSYKAPVSDAGDLLDALGTGLNALGEELQSSVVSRDYFDGIIQSMKESIIVITPTARIGMVNQATLDLLGYDEDEMLGMSLPSILHESISIEDMVGGQHEKTFWTKDGQEIQVLFSAAGIQGSSGDVVCVASDISERNREQAELNRVSQLLETIFEHTHMMVAYLDHEFNFVTVNQAYARIDNRDRDFFVGKNHFDLYPNEENRILFQQVVDTGEMYVTNARPFEYEYNPERATTYWDWSLVPVKAPSGEITGLILSLLNVTDRIRALQDQYETEVRFQAIVNSLEHAVLLFEPDTHKILTCNPAAMEIFGCSKEKLMGATLEFLYPDKKSYTQFREGLANALRESNTYDVEAQLQRVGDGTLLYTEITISQIADQEGRPIGLVGLFRDISERKRADEHLRASEARFRALVENSPDYITILNLEYRLQYLNVLAEGFTLADAIGKSTFDFLPPESHDMIRAELDSVAQSGQPGQYEVESYRRDGTPGWLSTRVVPILEGDQVTGIMLVVTDITDRQAAEEALRASELKYRTLIEQASDGIFVTNPAGQYVEVNQSGCEMLGYSRDELLNLSIQDLVPKDDQQAQPLQLDALRAGKSVRSERRMRCKDGRLITVEISAKMLSGGNMQAIVRDISERKQVEDALRESEERFSKAFQNNPTPMSIRRLSDDVIIDLNRSFEDLMGFTREELLGKKVSEVEFYINPADRQPILAHADKHIPTMLQTELTFKKPDGSHVQVILSVDNVMLGGEPCMLASFFDITERKDAEHAVRESEERYSSLFETTSVSLWEQDCSELKAYLDGLQASGVTDVRAYLDEHPEAILAAAPMIKLVRVNQPTLDMLEVETTEELFANMNRLWGAGALNNLKEEMIAIASGRTSLHAEFEVKTLRGKALHVMTDLTVSPGYEDTWERAIFSVVDITDRKAAEAELAIKEKAIATSISAIAMANMDGKLVYVNDSFLEMWGVPSREDALGIPTTELWTPMGESGQITEELVSSGQWLGEVEVHRRDGSQRIAQLASNAVFDEQGQPMRLMGSFIDITQRTADEERIRQALKEKEVLLREIHHRVKNNLQIIASLLDLQVRRSADEALRTMLQESRGRVKSMALVHERLYQTPDLSYVDFGDYLRGLITFLLQSYEINRELVTLDLKLSSVFLNIDIAIPCGLIINELISNALKHAFPDGRAGTISVELVTSSSDDHQVTLIVRDNGIGFPAEMNYRETESLGMTVVTTLVEQINGTIEMRNTGGTEFTLVFGNPGKGIGE